MIWKLWKKVHHREISSPFLPVTNLSNCSVKFNIKTIGQSNWHARVAITDSQMRTSERKPVVLIPMLERQIVQRCSIGELKVSEMPVNYLSISGTQVNVRRWSRVQFLQFFRQIGLLFFEVIKFFASLMIKPFPELAPQSGIPMPQSRF